MPQESLSWMMDPLGVIVELYDTGGQQVVRLPDPSGGRFDAAGDFDRLLPSFDAAYPVLGTIEPYGDTSLVSVHVTQLLQELDTLLPMARPGPERRGLLRLQSLAFACAEVGRVLVFRGD